MIFSATLVLVSLASCSDDSAAPVEVVGTVKVQPTPHTLGAAWTLTGPGGFEQTGSGDQELADLPPGDYYLACAAVPNWKTPPLETEELTAGSTITLTGSYEPDPLIDGTALVVDKRGLENSPGSSVLLSVDIRTGVADSLLILDHWGSIGCITRGPEGDLWAVAISDQELLRIDPESFEITSIGVMGNWSNERVVSLAFSPEGDLFGYDERRNSIVTINRVSAEVTVLAPDQWEWGAGLCFGPDGVLYFATYRPNRVLYTVDPATGLMVSLVGAIAYQDASGLPLITSMCFSEQGVLYGVSTGRGIATSAQIIDENLIEIDPLSGRVWAVGGVGCLGRDGFRTPSGLAFGN